MTATERPLARLRVLVTRPADPASRLSTALLAEGADVVELPTIRIDPPEDWGPVDAAIRAGRYDWVVFTSVPGVQNFCARLSAQGHEPTWFEGARVAAIGPETARRLEAEGVRPSLVPDEYVAEALVAEIDGAVPLTGRRVLLPGANIAREALAEGLQAAGAIVERLVVYRTVAPNPPPQVMVQLREGAIQVVTFTSSSTVTNLVSMLGADAAVLGNLVIACIGPVTADTVRQQGLEPTIVAATHTLPGLVAALRGYYLEKQAVTPGGPS